MNNNISVIILSFENNNVMHPGVPSGLISLGHYPCVCVLLETLLQFEEIVSDIHLLIRNEDMDLYKKEVSRWFYEAAKIFLYPIDEQGECKTMRVFLDDRKNSLQDNILILYSNIPLISKITLKDFISSHGNQHARFSSMISRLNNVNPFYKTRLIENRYIKEIGSLNETFDYSLLNTFIIDKLLLDDLISGLVSRDINELFQIIHESEDGSEIFILSPYIANKEFIMIQNFQDKNFAENIFLERRNLAFINQCYGLWKKCETLENRLESLEQKN